MNTTTASDVGTRIARRLAEVLGPRRYAMWFDRSAHIELEEVDALTPPPPTHDHTCVGALQVSVPNQFAADWIRQNFHDALREAAHHELGQQVPIDVRVTPERFSPAQQRVDTAAHASHPPAAHRTVAATRATRASRAAPSTRLSSLRHRLEDFIIGPSNELAYAAAERLANDDAAEAHSGEEAGGPLFLHGGCGLGKTHLLQGICRRVLKHRPDAHVLYTTGEQFTNEYITAVRTNKLERFRKWIRGLDLLAVDDVHFIANKQATQQEFLHSFDQIELSGARVVLASDSHPKLIEQFSEALVSRCVRGLVVPIKPPDAKTRMRLIQVLAERRSLHLSSAAARMLGQHCHGSVREIEGALTKLQALVTLARQNGQRLIEPIGPTLVQQLLDADATQAPRTPVRFETVIETVTSALGVTPQQVRGRGRHRLVVLARSLTIHLARELTSMSYPEIATALDRGNHSTIITAAQRIARQLRCETPVALPAQFEGQTLDELVAQLKRQITRG